MAISLILYFLFAEIGEDRLIKTGEYLKEKYTCVNFKKNLEHKKKFIINNRWYILFDLVLFLVAMIISILLEPKILSWFNCLKLTITIICLCFIYDFKPTDIIKDAFSGAKAGKIEKIFLAIFIVFVLWLIYLSPWESLIFTIVIAYFSAILISSSVVGFSKIAEKNKIGLTYIMFFAIGSLSLVITKVDQKYDSYIMAAIVIINAIMLITLIWKVIQFTFCELNTSDKALAINIIIGNFSSSLWMASNMFYFSSKLSGQFDGLNTYFDSIYFAVVTISTLGYGDIKPISDLAKFEVMIVASIGIVYMTLIIGPLVNKLNNASFFTESEKKNCE